MSADLVGIFDDVAALADFAEDLARDVGAGPEAAWDRAEMGDAAWLASLGYVMHDHPAGVVAVYDEQEAARLGGWS